MAARQATLKLDFLIVGAGLGGLAAAFVLARSGHRVRVFDKRDGSNHQLSHGVRIPPNLSKILYDWGLHDALSNAVRCRKTRFFSMATNELVGILEWQEDIVKETGGDFILHHYEDLYTMLYNLAVSVGASISFNSEVVSVSVDKETGAPNASLFDGTLLTADLIIGADGPCSIVREAVTGQVEGEQPSDHTFFTIVVPLEKMKTDPDWSKVVGLPEWLIWMDPSRSLTVYPIRGGLEYCAHLYLPHSDTKGDQKDSWTRYVPTSSLDLEGTDPCIRRLFSMVPESLQSKHVVRQPLDEWVDKSGTIVLIGEAAHPIMPFTIHNASLAVEDAVVLGSLMSHISRREQLPQMLEAYQDLGMSRVKQVEESELNNTALATRSDPELKIRNASFVSSVLPNLVCNNDERLSAQWEEIGAVFVYNAADVAEDWWIKWGALGDLNGDNTSYPVFNYSSCAIQTVDTEDA